MKKRKELKEASERMGKKEILTALILLVIAIILSIAHAATAVQRIKPATEILAGIAFILMIISVIIGFLGYRKLKPSAPSTAVKKVKASSVFIEHLTKRALNIGSFPYEGIGAIMALKQSLHKEAEANETLLGLFKNMLMTFRYNRLADSMKVASVELSNLASSSIPQRAIRCFRKCSTYLMSAKGEGWIGVTRDYELRNTLSRFREAEGTPRGDLEPVREKAVRIRSRRTRHGGTAEVIL